LQVQDDVHRGRTINGGDPPQDHGHLGMARKGQRLPALDHSSRGDPATVPDKRALFVVTTPHVAVVAWLDRVGTAPADERREHGVGVPPGCAHPGQVAVRADERPALAVGQKRILAENIGPVPT
jgi:hypothetical protein